MSFTVKTNNISKGLENMSEKMGAMLLMFLATEATRIEGDMKVNRPWTDRTGQAKETLTARVEQKDKVLRIKLAYGVDYGIWLELANEKNYAIIDPTIKKFSPLVMQDLSGILDKIK